MAKKITWSVKAEKERREILRYWAEKNGNKKYSNKLSYEFISATELISKFNNIGMITNYKNVRCHLCHHYKILYKIGSDEIKILALFDSRRNPKDLKLN